MNLLLVEDSLATRKLLATLVNSGGEQYHLFEAGSAEEALDILGPDNAPKIDVCLIDLRLPGMDGADLVREIRGRFGSAPGRPYIVIVTSDEMETTINRCIEAGANDYITKPVNLKVLQIRLRVARLLCRAGAAPAPPPVATAAGSPRQGRNQGRPPAKDRVPENQ